MNLFEILLSWILLVAMILWAQTKIEKYQTQVQIRIQKNYRRTW